MHIGLFTDCYTPQVNGVVTSVQILEKELRKQGHRVTVITVKVPGYVDDTPSILRIPSVPFIKWNEFRVGIPTYNETYRKIKKLELDVIHTHTEFTLGFIGKHMATRMNIPIVHTYHTMYEDYTHYVFDHRYGKQMVKKLLTTSSRLYVRRYDGIIAPTAKTEAALRSYGVRNKISVVPTGIDIDSFEHKGTEAQNNALRAKYGLKPSDYLLLSLGRVSKEKSVDAIIRQMPKIKAQIPEAKLLIVGDGPFKNALELMVAELNLTDCVLFTGQVPFEDVGGFYSAANLFVNASKTETQGLTIIEAIASNLPVVVYDDLNIEGVVIEEVSGRLFKEEATLRAQIIDAYKDKDSTEAMTANAYELVQALSKEKFAENVLSVYEGLLQETYMAAI